MAGIPIRDRLLADRRALLDLGTRNRLVHIPLRTKNIRAIEIVSGICLTAGGVWMALRGR